jgi:homoserine O-succinyltransferase/O-acetyltransferase
MTNLLRVAILDLNNNVPNRGITYLKRMVESFSDVLTYQVFDVRFKNEIPDTGFDIYLSSGGPGSPFDFTGGWDKSYFDLIEKLWQQNSTSSVSDKKHVFFICHSFQLACQHFKVGEISKRKAISFGTYPCNKTHFGTYEPFFHDLPNPFWIADFRDWQVVHPDKEDLKNQGFKIVALEKERPHVDLPRALMAIRFSNEFFGTQFHPEADDDGMLAHFQDPERKIQVVSNHGEKKYNQMITDLKDDMKINLTHKTILPSFLNFAIEQLKGKSLV